MMCLIARRVNHTKKKKDGKQAGRRIHCHTEKIKIKIEKKKKGAMFRNK